MESIIVCNLPSEQDIYNGVYLPKNHKLAGKNLFVTNGSITGYYVSQPLDDIKGLALNYHQRIYFYIKPNEEIKIMEATEIQINILPKVSVYFTFQNNEINCDNKIKNMIKDLKIVNINETVLYRLENINYKLRFMSTGYDRKPVRTNSITSINKSTLFALEDNQKLNFNDQAQNIVIDTNIFQSIDPIELNVGGLSKEFELIFTRLFLPFLLQNEAETYGLTPTRGCLLYGPPGTGKTVLAKGIAKKLQVDDTNVRIINGPEMSNKFIGQTEENVRNLFKPAENNPTKLHVIIFDEIDAIAAKRGNSGREHADGVLNQLLTKMDGISSPKNLLIIGITNRKDILDDALLRPGRLDVHIHVGLPDLKGRNEIFKIHCKKLIENKHLDPELIPILSANTPNFTGAEIEALVKTTRSIVLRRYVDINDINKSIAVLPKNITFNLSDFQEALLQITPKFGAQYVKNEVLYENKLKIYESLKNVFETEKIVISVLHGVPKSGKTIIARELLNNLKIEYKYYFGGRDVLGKTDEKIQVLKKIFTNEVTKGFIIIDNIEILLSISPGHYDCDVLQTLLLLLNERNHNVLLITKNLSKLQNLDIIDDTIEIFST